MTTLTKAEIEYQAWAWKIVERLLLSLDANNPNVAHDVAKIDLAKFCTNFSPMVGLALERLETMPRPIGPEASGIDILLFRDDGSCEFVEEEENDYEFMPYQGRYEGLGRPISYIPFSALRPKP